jgi:hypothetical protein
MWIYDDLYSWEGWGGKLRLASGSCRLRIFDFQKNEKHGLKHLRPVIAITTDVPESRMSIKGCAGHIATGIVETFGVDPQRMIYIEYYPGVVYGPSGRHEIPEAFEAVEFSWHEGKAVQPKWRPLRPPLLNIVKRLMTENHQE